MPKKVCAPTGSELCMGGEPVCVPTLGRELVSGSELWLAAPGVCGNCWVGAAAGCSKKGVCGNWQELMSGSELRMGAQPVCVPTARELMSGLELSMCAPSLGRARGWELVRPANLGPELLLGSELRMGAQPPVHGQQPTAPSQGPCQGLAHTPAHTAVGQQSVGTHTGWAPICSSKPDISSRPIGAPTHSSEPDSWTANHSSEPDTSSLPRVGTHTGWAAIRNSKPDISSQPVGTHTSWAPRHSSISSLLKCGADTGWAATRSSKPAISSLSKCGAELPLHRLSSNPQLQARHQLLAKVWRTHRLGLLP